MNNSRNGNRDIVLTQNGEAYNPVNLDIFLITAKLICCSIGIPLNLLIAVTIVRLRRLRCKPRNIFLLCIIFAYLSYYVPPLIELISFAFLPAESAQSVCRVFMSVSGLPHAFLLLTMLLALIDRYVAINYPLFHRDKMTVRFASGIISLTAISIAFLVKFVFIAGIAPLGCELWIVHSKILGLTISVLFVSCTVLNLIVYRKTRTHLRESRTLEITNGDRIYDEVDGQHIAVCDGGNTTASSPLATSGNEFLNARASVSSSLYDRPAANNVRPMSIHVDRDTLSQMEIEATRSLLFGVTSLVVTVCPIIILLLTFLACRMIGQFDCNSLTWLAAYVKELGLIHAIYNPLIFLIRYKELRNALTTRLINRG